ncbi:MAG TPA: class I adenylate-forming enzyme family protein [Burkholderiaceae bacterium]|nr:class I adenylate-forming enzyme family protein [Burkholderiaceae bacterium]
MTAVTSGGSRGDARVDAIVADMAAQRGDAIALVSEAGARITYRALAAAIDAQAQVLREYGIGAGDRVLLVGESTADMIVWLFAAVRAGAWAVPVNARLAGGEIDAIRAHCEPRAVYFSSASPEALAHALAHAERIDARSKAKSPRLLRFRPPLPNGDAAATEDVAAGDFLLLDHTAPRVFDDDVAVMIYTSGSTGQPKGVMLTHRNLTFIAGVTAQLGSLQPEDRIYFALPISHSYGLTSVLLCGLQAAATLYPAPRFAAERLVNALRNEGITVFQGVPAMYARLVEWAQAHGNSIGPHRLRLAYIGGSMIDPARKAAAEQLLGLRLHHGYGLTEAAPSVTRTLGAAAPADTSVGWPLPGVEVRLRAADGTDVPLDSRAEGELLVRGPNVMKGYFRDPQQTRKAVDAEGWLHTGDLARRGANGDLTIVGRIKELIIRNGFNVYPAEVERAINAFGGVAQCAVVGRAHDGDEEVVAFIEPLAGQPIDTAALRAYLRTQLAPYKIPGRMIVMERLPASGTGKVLKAALVERAGAMPG